MIHLVSKIFHIPIKIWVMHVNGIFFSFFFILVVPFFHVLKFWAEGGYQVAGSQLKERKLCICALHIYRYDI